MTNENEKVHVLIVDDDRRILRLLKQFLQKSGYLVSSALSAMEAAEYLKYYIFDIMVLDVMMPSITGLEFAKKIKSNINNIPIILLTALSEPEDKIRGLQTKADDYMTKPFDPRELVLRIENLINLYGHCSRQQEIIKLGNGTYNIVTKQIRNSNNDVVILSSTEQKLLEILIQLSNQPIKRQTISKFMGSLNERSVDVQIKRLRNKIEDDPKQPKILQTIRNKGYILYI